MNNKLHTGIKSIVESQGKDVIKTVLLANILADYGAYNQYPTTKVVLKELLNQGYGQKIYDILCKSTLHVQEDFLVLKSEFQKKTNFKHDILNYVFDSFLFAFNLISKIEEPYSQGFDPYASESDDILQKLPTMLEKLKKEYSEAIDKLLTKPANLIWDAPAYYTAEAENKLFLIEGKIQVISNQLGTSNLNWCKSLKAQKLNTYRTRKINAAKELLESKKVDYTYYIKKAFKSPTIGYSGKSLCFDEKELENIKKAEDTIIGLYREQGIQYDYWCHTQKGVLIETALSNEKKTYLSILKNSLFIPSSKFISRSAYFNPARLNEIHSHEVLIEGMYNEKGEPYNNWCEKEKDNILAPYVVSKSKQIRQAVLKVLLPLAIAGGTGTQYISYSSSSASIELYDQTIQRAEQLASQNNYGKAIAAFLSAEANYNGSYKSESYKNEAHVLANKTFETLKSSVESKIANKKYKQVLDELDSIPSEFIQNNSNAKTWIERTKEELKIKVDKDINDLPTLISKNGGNLGQDGKQLLDELISVSPDNYWLRFLKNKK